MSIGDRIREVRKKQGVSQTVFATTLEVSRSAIRAYELNEREPSSSFLVRLYTDLSIEPTWLLTGTGAKTSKGRSENIVNAVVAVKTFSALKNINFKPEKEAKLVLLLSEYFEEGGEHDGSLVQNMLESSI